MVDPVTALATATAAFNVIKKGFSVGKDIESMYGDMGRWMGACSDINQADKMSKNPPIFKKVFAGASIEEEALNAFAAKKKAQAMEYELRSYINMVHGPSSWNELLSMQAKIRKQRQEFVYKQQERRKKILEIFFVSLAGILALALMVWVASGIANKVNAHELCDEFERAHAVCLNEGYDTARAQTYGGRLPRKERFINCRFVDQKPILNREDKVVGMTCRYKYPNEDSFMFVTPGDRYHCPRNLTCKVTN